MHRTLKHPRPYIEKRLKQFSLPHILQDNSPSLLPTKHGQFGFRKIQRRQDVLRHTVAERSSILVSSIHDRDVAVAISVHQMHLGRLTFPILCTALYDAKTIYPDIPNIKEASNLDCLLEVLGKEGPGNAFRHKLLSVVIM